MEIIQRKLDILSGVTPHDSAVQFWIKRHIFALKITLKLLIIILP